MTQRVGKRPRTSGRRARVVLALTVSPDVRLRVSDAGFWRLCRLNPELRLERTARGELIVMPPVGTGSGGRNARLTYRLGQWAEADGTGHYFDSSTGYKLPNGATRSPDASWIRKDRWSSLAPAQKERFAPICPDFVVELCSPSDDKETIREKVREYMAQGARLGWLIDPRDRTAEIFRPGRDVEIVGIDATLTGEDVLPGFVLELKEILFI